MRKKRNLEKKGKELILKLKYFYIAVIRKRNGNQYVISDDCINL